MSQRVNKMIVQQLRARGCTAQDGVPRTLTSVPAMALDSEHSWNMTDACLDRGELALAWHSSQDLATGRATPKPSDLRLLQVCNITTWSGSLKSFTEPLSGIYMRWLLTRGRGLASGIQYIVALNKAL